MTESKGNKNGIMERTNKTNTSKHDWNSPPPPSVAQFERKKIHTIHTYSQLQKKHHTGTEVMAKNQKAKQNKTLLKKEEYCMPYPYNM
jgi:hypothetical protein